VPLDPATRGAGGDSQFQTQASGTAQVIDHAGYDQLSQDERVVTPELEGQVVPVLAMELKVQIVAEPGIDISSGRI